MSAQAVALSILLFPAAGALLLAGRGWRLPRIVTQIVGPGVVWLSFAATLRQRRLQHPRHRRDLVEQLRA